VFHPAGLAGSSGYSHVVRAGDFVVVSGQVARDADGQVVGRGDAGAQARLIFENLDKALTAAGASLDDVVKLTIFVTDISARAAVSRVRDERLADPKPASTFLVVAGLTDPDFLLEIEALAYAPG
jgi:enamine deaminase RidA (YjgF/YER057c/UK114 family)